MKQAFPPPLPDAATAARSTTGFASPASPYREAALDLNTLLTPQRESCFFFRFRGMRRDGALKEGDILIVDRSRRPQADDLVLMSGVDGFLLRRFSGHPPAVAEECGALQVWGVVLWSLRRHLSDPKGGGDSGQSNPGR